MGRGGGSGELLARVEGDEAGDAVSRFPLAGAAGRDFVGVKVDGKRRRQEGGLGLDEVYLAASSRHARAGC